MLLVAFIVGFSYSGRSQNIYIHTTDGNTFVYPLIDISSVTLPDNLMSVNFIDGDTLSWNRSTIQRYEYDQWYVSVEEGVVLSEVGVNVYPNPASDGVWIKYGLLEGANVTISVNDLSGRLVDTVFSGAESNGVHAHYWSFDSVGSGVPSGVYVCTLTIGRMIFSKRIVISRS